MGNWSVVFVVSMSILVSLCHGHNSPQDYVDEHNCEREQLGLPPVCWDDDLAKYAECYANERMADCAMVHSNTEGKIGENLAMGPDLTGRDAVKMWISEKPDYNYETNECCNNMPCLHYTQVIWKDSTKIGCARVECVNNPPYYFVGCNYCPPGNMVGRKPY